MWNLSSTRLQAGSNGSGHSRVASVPEFFNEDLFLSALCRERKRTERSGSRFVLMLLESEFLSESELEPGALTKVLWALAHSTRETDVRGWYRTDAVLGVIFTDVGNQDGHQIGRALLNKVTAALSETLTVDEISDIRISFHAFPENWDKPRGDGHSDPVLYPDLAVAGKRKALSFATKRAADIGGALLGLIVASPLLVIISILIKLTSPGPVLFRQTRLGQYGKEFTFLKFRSMRQSSDEHVHRAYMEQFIAGEAHRGSGPQGVYKITQDDRITAVGRFLRRSSLDELPQIINVLRGEMSLVGPRPAIPYEARCYGTWHRRRLLAVKPGITGLWQVAGRSRVTFDEMVRLDLEYATNWSGWLDTKIVLQTPRAVLSGDGAY